MKNQNNYKGVFRFALSLLNLGLMGLVWGGIWMSYYADDILRPFGYKGNWLVIAVYVLLLFFFTTFYGGYKIGYHRWSDLVLSGYLALVMTNIVTYLQTMLVARGIINALPFLVMCVIQAAIVASWSYLTTWGYLRIFPPQKMLLIYGGVSLALSLVQKMIGRAEKYSIQEEANCEEYQLEELYKKIDGYESVILCDLPPKLRNRLLKYAFNRGIRTYTTPKISDILLRGAMDINLFDTPLLLNRNRGLSFEQRMMKRAMDLVVSAIVLILTSGFMLLTALAVKMQDGGPVLFRQKRYTLDMKEFYVIKFRSMVMDAEADGKSRPAVDGDPRITRVGKFIRMTRLDELPQLFNILRGDMSLVGPRPERVEHVEQYTRDISEFAFRYKVKAGLTGFAQVYGKYNTSAYDKLKMDLMYISNYSIATDLKILLMTIKVIFQRESTEGFEKNGYR